MVPIVALPSAIYWRTSDIGVGDDQRQRPGLYAANPDSIVVPHAMRSDENVVVRDRRFELQQEVFVFGIVSGSLRVRAREPFDLFDGSPERYRQEMRPLTLSTRRTSPPRLRRARSLRSSVLLTYGSRQTKA